MTNQKQRGFTLIELLVVILIIGILAAVALPQYQQAVLKSDASAQLVILKELAQAQEVYFLQHGEYASSFAQLDVPLSPEWNAGCHIGNFSQFYPLATDCHENGNWTLSISQEGSYTGSIYLGLKAGPYQWAGFYYMPYKQIAYGGGYNSRGLGCLEYTTYFKDKHNLGDWCTKIWGKTLIVGSAVHFFK